MDQQQRKLLEQILEYVIQTEEQHFEECGEPADHVYAQAYLLRQLIGAKQ